MRKDRPKGFREAFRAEASKPPKEWKDMSMGERLAGLLGLVLVVAIIVFLVSTMLSGGGGKPTDWAGIISALETKEAGFVYDARYEDNLLIINVIDGTTEFAATRLACEDVKPFLEQQGVGGTQFAIYLPDGKVVATGSRC